GRTYWTTEEGVIAATLECTLPARKTFDRAMLQEYIRAGQRVEQFHIDAESDGAWKRVASGTTIGYKRLVRFSPVTASKIRLVIERARWSPAISTFGLFKAPPTVTVIPGGGAFEDSMTVRLATDVEGASIYYTLDGSLPTTASRLYTGPFTLRTTSQVTAVASLGGDLCVETTGARFARCFPVAGITLETPPADRYPGHGSTTLIDGARGSEDPHDGRWLGFEGSDVSAVLDLGSVRPVGGVTAGFLEQQGSWIFLPSRVECAVSTDGRTWQSLTPVLYPPKQEEGTRVVDCTVPAGGVSARYVRVVARSIGECPPWHPGAGGKAWVFIDEIIVE
ncbi:MAG TPA: chitobiase/beta-hexosaminidase C-terminal domain-containing protein, partial [Bacteroidota bacterium]|nr:chitobiase/beta-hexosaminidase C-terminal domain-containing protein [Bacteroidota bacterium]